MAGHLEAVESQQGQRKYKVQTSTQNEAPRRMWPETHLGTFPEAPLGHSEKLSWLWEYFLFLSKGEWVIVNGTKHYRQGSRTMYFELMESQERAACFRWE